MLRFMDLNVKFHNCKTEKDLPGINRAYDYLAARGITLEDVERLGLHIMPANELIHANKVSNSDKEPNKRDARIAIVFPHYTLHGQLADWWFARLVGGLTPVELRLVGPSFADITDKTKNADRKVFCPPKEPPIAYLPPLVDWAKLPMEATVYIHESAIKAINCAKLGKYSIGLNGVYGWCSRKFEIPLLHEIKDLPWKERKLRPVICFDSNYDTNWGVQDAITKLAQKMHEICGVRPVHLPLPKAPDGTDWGFDDYCQHYGPAVALQYLEAEGREIDGTELHRQLVDLNNRVVVVRGMSRIAEIDTCNVWTASEFMNVTYADWISWDTTGETPKPMSTPKEWLRWKEHRQVEALCYEPGQPEIYKNNLNKWRHSGVVPEAGDVDPWLELIANNIHEDGVADHMIDWLAYTVQNPGRKIKQLLHIFGPQGTGKNLLMAPIAKIFGSNYVLINAPQLKSQFTSLYAEKELVHIDELPRLRGRKTEEADAINQKIKSFVTDEFIIVNTKRLPEYIIRNCANIVLTSNYYDCVKLDNDDRRSFVIRWEPTERTDHRRDPHYWQRYAKWMDAGGISALYAYLLERDISHFNPDSWAPETAHKRAVIESSMDALEHWVHDLRQDTEWVPPLTTGKVLYTTKELALLFFEGHTEDTISKRMLDAVANELRNAGYRQANNGKSIKTQDGRVNRYWVILQENANWENSAACSAHLNRWYRRI